MVDLAHMVDPNPLVDDLTPPMVDCIPMVDLILIICAIAMAPIPICY